MARWISAARHDYKHLKILVPREMIRGTPWESCKFTTAERRINGTIIIRRLPGDGKTNNEGPEHTVEPD